MFSGFFQKSTKKINFEDVQIAMKHPNQYVIINTMSITEQDCLIKYTLDCSIEEKVINEMLNTYDFASKKIIIYGKNSNDETSEKKYNQITHLGFSEVYLYVGGMFEWMLLQDIYGFDEFPTTKKVLDILKFRPQKNIQ